jgi:hypothetical protein
VVAPAIPLPAQVVEEPLTGLRVPEEGVDAEAGKTNAQDIATRNISVSFKLEFSLRFEAIALLGSGAEIVDKTAFSFRIFDDKDSTFDTLL